MPHVGRPLPATWKEFQRMAPSTPSPRQQRLESASDRNALGIHYFILCTMLVLPKSSQGYGHKCVRTKALAFLKWIWKRAACIYSGVLWWRSHVIVKTSRDCDDLRVLESIIHFCYIVSLGHSLLLCPLHIQFLSKVLPLRVLSRYVYQELNSHIFQSQLNTWNTFSCQSFLLFCHSDFQLLMWLCSHSSTHTTPPPIIGDYFAAALSST